MKRGQQSIGFTIIESLMFLAVSSALITSALLLVSGSQNKTEFNQAITEVRQQIEDTANNVANGYYAGAENTSCSISGGKPSVSTSPSSERGSSAQCVFIGRVLYFSQGSDFLIYNVAGLRETTVAGRRVPVTKMSQAQPTSFGREELRMKSGLRLEKMRSVSGVTEQTAAVGFFSTLGSTESSSPDGQLQSGSQQYDIIGIPNTNLGSLPNDSDVSSRINALGTSVGPTSLYDQKKNPRDGVQLCFQSGSTDDRAIITIGGGSRGGTTTLNVERGNCSAW